MDNRDEQGSGNSWANAFVSLVSLLLQLTLAELYEVHMYVLTVTSRRGSSAAHATGLPLVVPRNTGQKHRKKRSGSWERGPT